MNAIRILITGGTFDKEYDEIRGCLFFKETHLSEMLKLGRCERPLQTQTLMMVDSLDMGEGEREKIAKAAKESVEAHLVITHGTDTMTTTAEYLANAKIDKTIVLTGAMIPYKFGSSDGLFNLGSAIAYADLLPKGVYIAMNGRYFEWDKVAKDRSLGRFVSK